ncbi:MAG: sphingomyelin phosphodiesterase [Bdellovibrionales bacterium]|nr:sphingomyelin phosphodiesterase [Bdellovibrionales bacterium]
MEAFASNLLKPQAAVIPAADRLRVLTYNVWALPGPLLVDPDRLGEIARRLVDTGADVIALQEVFSRRAIAALGELSGFPHRAWGEQAPGGFQQGSGLLLLSRYPIVTTARTRYSRATGTDRLACKGALHARLALPSGRELDLFNTHLNAGGPEADALRAHQARELVDFTLQHAARGAPQVVVGDFNFTPRCGAYAAFARDSGLRDAHPDYLDAVREGRRPAPGGRPVILDRVRWQGLSFDPERNPFSRQYSPQTPSCRIDQVWVGGSASLEVAETQLFFDHPRSCGRPLSDHFGVGADLEIR